MGIELEKGVSDTTAQGTVQVLLAWASKGSRRIVRQKNLVRRVLVALDDQGKLRDEVVGVVNVTLRVKWADVSG